MADENPIERLRPGQILADSAVTDYIKAMGIAIAEAQMQLDINSLRQVGEYVEPRPGLGGRSLLQLGLSPPFYHYQHADLSVSMQIVMKVAEQTAFGIGAKLDLGFEQGGPQAAAAAREAQVTVRSTPASVTVNGQATNSSGSDLEAAGEQLAAALRSPTGPFERAITSTERRPVQATLEPGTASNPILTPGSVVFVQPEASSAGVIRISTAPPGAEAYVLNATKTANIATPGANRVLHARAVTAAINGVGGFRARLVNDPGGSTTTPDAPGALGIVLFDTDQTLIKRPAADELDIVARIIRDGNLNVVITGYADTQGRQPTAADRVAYNRDLGLRRARAVRQALIDRGVAAARIADPVQSGGEDRWAGSPVNIPNEQFRRAEITLAGSTDLLIVVESGTEQLQETPTPDLTGGGAGNGFVFARRFSALPINGTAVLLGASATRVAISTAAVNSGGTTHAAGSAGAAAFNLTRDINAGTATHRVRATQNGGVVVLANADDAVVIDLVTLSANDITLAAGGGAAVTRPLGSIAAGPTASRDRPRVTAAVGISVDYRRSRQFEQSVNGNSAISARLVSVPAPVEFLDELKQYLGAVPQPRPPQG
jgi:outer membrane protein OmpA-like peptidoglycan-associated protein